MLSFLGAALVWSEESSYPTFMCPQQAPASAQPVPPMTKGRKCPDWFGGDGWPGPRWCGRVCGCMGGAPAFPARGRAQPRPRWGQGGGDRAAGRASTGCHFPEPRSGRTGSRKAWQVRRPHIPPPWAPTVCVTRGRQRSARPRPHLQPPGPKPITDYCPQDRRARTSPGPFLLKEHFTLYKKLHAQDLLSRNFSEGAQSAHWGRTF